MEAFRNLADSYGCWIIEDACHAPGGYFKNSINENQFCGNGKYADLSIFSFHPVKHIAAGEGGMITTNDEDLYKKLLSLRTHGITKEKSHVGDSHGGWYYEMQGLGFNYRLTDFQAALGSSQLNRAPEGIAIRRAIAARYDRAFTNKDYIKSHSGVEEGHAYHLYVIEVNDRKGLYEYLRVKNILTQVHYIPVHLMPYYRQYGWKEGDFVHAENYYQQSLSLPMYPTLTYVEQKFVIDSINEYFSS